MFNIRSLNVVFPLVTEMKSVLKGMAEWSIAPDLKSGED